MTLRPRDKAALAIVGVLAVLAGYYMLVLAPVRHQASSLESSISTQRAALTQAESTFASGRAAQHSLRAHAAEWAALRVAVPEQADIPALLRTLQRTARSADVSMKAIQLESSSSSAAAPPTTGSPTGSASSATASSVPIQLSFSGGYTQLAALVRKLTGLVSVSGGNVRATGPLLSISQVSLTGSPLTVQMTATIYQLGASTASSSTGGQS